MRGSWSMNKQMNWLTSTGECKTMFPFNGELAAHSEKIFFDFWTNLFLLFDDCCFSFVVVRGLHDVHVDVDADNNLIICPRRCIEVKSDVTQDTRVLESTQKNIPLQRFRIEFRFLFFFFVFLCEFCAFFSLANFVFGSERMLLTLSTSVFFSVVFLEVNKSERRND